MPSEQHQTSFWTLKKSLLSYADGLRLQELCLSERRKTEADILLLLEHSPVITYGRGAHPEHLLVSHQQLKKEGIDLYQAGRGGDMTYHGPGQLVGYPIVDLNAYGRDLHRYLRMLEDVLITTVADFGVTAQRRPGRTGIWVGPAKLASIGVGVRRWLSWHGFALNLAGDLKGFDRIIPCGLQDVRMISLEQLLSHPPAREDVEVRLITAFADIFGSHHLGDYEEETNTQA